MRSCDRRRRTRDSVLTPTVSRKLTGLRSRMMALGRDGSRIGAISMTATSRCSSISCAPSCAGGQIANVVRIQESLQRKHIEHNEQKSGLRWKGSFRKGHWIGQNHLDKQFSVTKKLQINTINVNGNISWHFKKEKWGKVQRKQVRQDDSTHHSLTLCICLTIFFSCLFRLASSFLFADKTLPMLIPD